MQRHTAFAWVCEGFGERPGHLKAGNSLRRGTVTSVAVGREEFKARQPFAKASPSSQPHAQESIVRKASQKQQTSFEMKGHCFAVRPAGPKIANWEESHHSKESQSVTFLLDRPSIACAAEKELTLALTMRMCLHGETRSSMLHSLAKPQFRTWT